MTSPLRQPGLLAVFLVVTLGGGLLIGVSNPPGAWYEALAKPGFTPPNRLFPIAWTMIYSLVAVAGWLVVGRGPRAGQGLWILQIALNFSWPPIFFGAHRIGLGLAVIALLLVTALAFVAATIRANRPAALCFLPYAAWVAYATALNFSIWRMN